MNRNIEIYLNINKFYKPTFETALLKILGDYLKIKEFDYIFVIDDELESCVLNSFNFTISPSKLKNSSLSWPHRSCIMPIAYNKIMKITFSGLPTIFRLFVKNSGNEFSYLLGLKGRCFKACSEVSTWTRFFEILLPNAIKKSLFSNNDEDLWQVLYLLESEFLKPPIIDNINKRSNNLKGVILKKHHLFIEGIDPLISDLIALFSFSILFNYRLLNISKFFSKLPKLNEWYWRCLKFFDCVDFLKKHLPKLFSDLHTEELKVFRNFNSEFSQLEKIKSNSFFSIKFLKEHVQFLKQPIDSSSFEQFTSQILKSIDFVSHFIPSKRAIRKKNQLTNVLLALLNLSPSYNHLVDFCAGSGLVGLALSSLLPDHQISIIENKEKSLGKAAQLALTSNNVQLFQCNMENFQQTFGLGFGLHACGLASDLILNKAIKNRASFVIVPCCYGFIKKTSSFSYPRSEKFKNIISSFNFQTIAHSADDNNTVFYSDVSLGMVAMNFIDSDRLQFASENGYKTCSYTMKPDDCSPKNQVLVGIPEETLVLIPKLKHLFS